MLILLGLFLVVPVLMALWVSVSDWGGRGSPFSADVSFVGPKNYAALLLGGGLAEHDFGMSAEEQRLVRDPRGPDPDRAGAVPRGAREPADPEGARVLPHRLLLPVGDQLGRDHRAVAVPVLHHRRGQRRARLARASTDRTGSTRRPASSTSAPHGGPGRAHAEHASSASRTGIGSAARRVAMCAYIIMAVFTTSGTFMLLFLAALQNLCGRGAGGGDDGWRERLAALLAGHAAAAAADPVHRAHARPDRLLADLRPDLHRHPGRSPPRPRSRPRTCRTSPRSPTRSGARAPRSRSSCS